MKYTTTNFFLAIIFSFGALGQSNQDVVVSHHRPGNIEVTFEPNVWVENYNDGQMRGFSRVRFLGESHENFAVGKPITPHRDILIDLLSSDFHLEIIDSEFRDTIGLRILPYPKLRLDEEFGFYKEYAGTAPNEETTISRKVVELVDVAKNRDGFVGTLRFYPVQYFPSENRTRIYDRITVQIVSEPIAVQVIQKEVVQDSPLKVGEWYRFDIKESGIYKIDRPFLTNANIPLSSISNINSIRIFGNGGEMLSEDLAGTKPQGLLEVGRHVVDRNGNGQFDTDDFVLFFGKSPRGWTYDKDKKTFSHYINHYSETNHYFLTFGGTPGKSMDSVASQNSATPFRPADYQGRVFVEEERFNLNKSGKEWFGQVFDPEASSAVYATTLHGIDAAKPVTYRFVVLARSNIDESFRIDENNLMLGRIPTYWVDVSSIETDYAYRSPVHTFTRTGAYADNRSVLKFTYEVKSTVSKGWLDWFEIFYRRKLVTSSDSLHFTSPDTTSIVEYQLSGFSSRDIQVFDVSRHSEVSRITGLNHDLSELGKFTFQSPQSSGSVREFLAVGPKGYGTPKNLQRIDNSNLWGISQGAEFIIITPKEFISEATRLKNHREQRDSLSTIIVRVDQIYNEFSGGLQDPNAVRNFLERAYTTWQIRPKYVLLFGDGHYDYKNITSTARNWIPPYETSESIHQILSYTTDDHFVRLNSGNSRVSLAIGRLPVASLKEATTVTDKIIRYETSSTLDPWRNRVTFVADDGLTSTGDDGNVHTYQTEMLAQSFTPPSTEKKKIYIIEYPTISSASGRRKPDANRAIIEALNRGSVIINFIGHGNPQLWAHEAIFTREGSLPQLFNRDRLTFLVAATCDFARYDNPGEQSAGEEILVMEKGGAIGVVTASRPVYSFENSQFNNTFYSELFRRDTDGRMPRLGDAMFRTKQIHYSVNDMKYHLLSDPTLRLAVPRVFVRIDSVNSKSVTNVVQMKTLSKVPISGSVQKKDGKRWEDFSGRAIVEVFDSKRNVSIAEWGNYSYELDGSLLYRGEITIAGGKYSAIAPLPKDVSYDNNRSRISLYGWNLQTDVIGFTENVIISGTDSTTDIDTTGPKIELYLNDESFRPGDIVQSDALMIVKLRDNNGINTSTAGIGHRLEARLKSIQRTIDLSQFYRSDLDTYQSGVIYYPLQSLPEGRHLLSVKAWDTFNNSSEAELFFEVRASVSLSIHNVLNVPNPFHRTTVFTFQRNSTEAIDVEIKIYTLAGRLIESIQKYGVLDRFVQVEWEGRDRDGNEIANGVYFYKVIAKSLETNETQEALGKLSVLR